MTVNPRNGDRQPMASRRRKMGNVWFCCWFANRVCNWFRPCRSSKDSALEFRDIRSGMMHWLDVEFPIPITAIALVTSSILFCNSVE
ncbi:hypothetical protein L484_023794 [Morus notabilis]|uniref:Uncharacterized protein n=1 Tax=Morus notabilis TaxID=981085 RepID=W9RTK9_9ROSA|nr:hypothetical protein L484_023794 [Morus notabilis]